MADDWWRSGQAGAAAGAGAGAEAAIGDRNMQIAPIKQDRTLAFFQIRLFATIVDLKGILTTVSANGSAPSPHGRVALVRQAMQRTMARAFSMAFQAISGAIWFFGICGND